MNIVHSIFVGLCCIMVALGLKYFFAFMICQYGLDHKMVKDVNGTSWIASLIGVIAFLGVIVWITQP